ISPDTDRLICTEILRRGYRLGDQLLRPAHVEVTGPPPLARNQRGTTAKNPTTTQRHTPSEPARPPPRRTRL
ncbi:hypothetical protein AB0K75_45490, partial [Streptomyces sp. NPDC055692]